MTKFDMKKQEIIRKALDIRVHTQEEEELSWWSRLHMINDNTSMKRIWEAKIIIKEREEKKKIGV